VISADPLGAIPPRRRGALAHWQGPGPTRRAHVASSALPVAAVRRRLPTQRRGCAPGARRWRWQHPALRGGRGAALRPMRRPSGRWRRSACETIPRGQKPLEAEADGGGGWSVRSRDVGADGRATGRSAGGLSVRPTDRTSRQLPALSALRVQNDPPPPRASNSPAGRCDPPLGLWAPWPQGELGGAGLFPRKCGWLTPRGEAS
jgi:hypothetical protein